MIKQGSNILIFNFKIFYIPDDFRYLNDIDPKISDILKTTHRYKVKSIISEEVFQSFINYWVNREIPEFRLETIQEYEIISQEFDYMKDLVQLFQRFTTNLFESNEKIKNKEIKKLIKENNKKIIKQTKKYQQIIKYLFQNSKNNSCFMFNINKKELFDAVKKMNSNLVNYLTRKSVNQGGLLFILNEENMTAVVYRNASSNGDIFIPKTIEYAFKKFVITGIAEAAFNSSNKIQLIQFSEDSELQTIFKSSFSNSSLVAISIPKSVTRIEKLAFNGCNHLRSIQFHKNSELKVFERQLFQWSSIESIEIPSCIQIMRDGWCSGILKLDKLKINDSSNKKNISLFENSLIVGKSDIKSDEFDVVHFARRDIEKVTIPIGIRAILPYSFENCVHIKNVTFSEHSNLRLIDKFAFNKSSIESITIPDRLEYIGDFSFSMCKKLKNVYFSNDSELHSINRFAFSKSSIQSIQIPKKVTKISESAFRECSQLESVYFSENSNLRVIENSAFSWSAIQKVEIPSHVTKICDMAFSSCYGLKEVEFADDSELKSIGQFAFSTSSIEKLSIPSGLVELGEGWCCETQKFNEIKVSTKNKIFTICNDSFLAQKSTLNGEFFDVLVFSPRNIQKVVIPPFIEKIESYAFQYCGKIQKVVFSDESELDSIGKYAFSYSSLPKLLIPSNTRIIGEFAFYNCDALKRIDISENSNLMFIDQFAFAFSSLKSFYVPESVVEISDYAFSSCQNLRIIEFSDNSKIRSIRFNILANSSIEIIIMPANAQKNYSNRSIWSLFK